MNKAVVLILALVANACAEELVATVLLTPDTAFKERNVGGTLKIVQSVANGPVTITGSITGLNSNGIHGFHVHATGDLSGGCKTAGAHFNPEKVNHGAPEDTVRHVGDLGNIKADADGTAQINITDTMISLTGPNNILGRAIVVHSQEDDLGKGNTTVSAQTGNAGDRWACGVIGVLSPEGSWPSSASTLQQTGSVIFLSIALYFITSYVN